MKTVTSPSARRGVFAVAAVLLLSPCALLPSDDLESRIRATIDRGLPSVGTISTETDDGLHFGSAFVIDREKGWLLSNYHVVAHSHRLSFQNAQTVSPIALELAYFEKSTDLALLVARDPRRLPPALELLPQTETTEQGQLVIAMGTPEGLGQTTTLGLVSAVERTLADSTVRGPFLQVDAAVYEGSSGGPLFNLEGQVVGIVTRRAASGHAAFALPAGAAHRFLDNFERRGSDRATAKLEGHLGAELQALSRPLSRYFDYAGRGVVVAGTYPRSAARAAGLRAGDVLLRLDDSVLDAADEGSLGLAESVIAAAAPGTHRLEILRQGQVLEIDVELAASPPCHPRRLEYKNVARLTHHQPGSCFRFPEGDFVEVTSFSPATTASDSSMRRPGDEQLAPLVGDLLVEVLGFDSLIEALTPTTETAEPPGPRLAKVLRTGKPRLVLLDRP